MIPASFEYSSPSTLAEAIALLQQHGSDAKILAGGQSLIPLMKLRMAATFGAGYDYTYLYPGIQKVVQAAGRVIRSRQDRGVVYLIDDRFARPVVRQLLPSWWSVSA